MFVAWVLGSCTHLISLLHSGFSVCGTNNELPQLPRTLDITLSSRLDILPLKSSSILSNTNASSNPTTRLAPFRRLPGPVILEALYLHRRQMSSQQSDITCNSTSSNPTITNRTRSRIGGGCCVVSKSCQGLSGIVPSIDPRGPWQMGVTEWWTWSAWSFMFTANNSSTSSTSS